MIQVDPNRGKPRLTLPTQKNVSESTSVKPKSVGPMTQDVHERYELTETVPGKIYNYDPNEPLPQMTIREALIRTLGYGTFKKRYERAKSYNPNIDSQLAKKITLSSATLPKEWMGAFSPSDNTLELPERKIPKSIEKEVVAHELQHAQDNTFGDIDVMPPQSLNPEKSDLSAGQNTEYHAYGYDANDIVNKVLNQNYDAGSFTNPVNSLFMNARDAYMELENKLASVSKMSFQNKDQKDNIIDGINRDKSVLGRVLNAYAPLINTTDPEQLKFKDKLNAMFKTTVANLQPPRNLG